MDRVALLVSTYDGACDLWRPLEETYLKFWADCPYEIYLSNNEKDASLELFRKLQIGAEKSWSDNMLKSLRLMPEDYVLLTFDDLFLYKKIETTEITKLISWAVTEKVSYLQLYPSISRGKKINSNSQVFEKVRGSKYRNATVFSLWKKSVLISLLNDEESAWEFETKGNIRCQKLESFYGVREPLIPYLNGVVKGKWNPVVKRKLLLLGLDLDNSRSQFGLLEFLRYETVKIAYALIRFARGVFS